MARRPRQVSPPSPRTNGLSFSLARRIADAPLFRAPVSAAALKRWAAGRRDSLAPSKALRVWVPQCAGGEDAYSVAIVLLEALGSRWREIPLCVFGTDSDPAAVARARAGRYPASAARGVARKRRERFFNEGASSLAVKPLVRDACRFVAHDPAASAHFHRLDLIVCRDILASLPPPARLEALARFHAALGPGGALIDRTLSASAAPALFKAKGGGVYAAKGLVRAPERAGLHHEARLRESEERFRLLFSRSEDAVLVRDAQTDMILQANTAAERLFGWTVAELLAMRGADLAVAKESVRRAQNERRSEARLALPHFRRKDGSVFTADTTTSFLMIEGRPCHLDLTRDATARLRALAARKREEAHKTFVGEVVHELRSPITVIRGSVELLRDGAHGARKRKSFLEFIDNHAGRMAALVDRLLDLDATGGMKRRSEPVPVALAPALWEIVQSFIPVAKRRAVSISIGVPEGLTVLADPADLPHVFGNLLDNAIKFSPRGGRVEVRGRAEGGEGLLSVRDTGGGIAPGDMDRLFERFFRGERTRRVKGTGLGLAIVRDIVTANHGSVRAENAPQGGGLFTVALPLAPGDPS